ncbi:hypothetical protein CKM354_001164800 [Cercospora kikuchii]|uniref:Cytochrome P450 n=1 Tax=Cercospora kikuchii TaxID=84275 RepID=A0A9P3CYT1_9PEZI|nr:uncharacterized protein CKM354_001164800 [Cercospora kikuchii]GIZ48595.1 hypothetical protein CKM354_001164800 [Cercospora kikuchii]
MDFALYRIVIVTGLFSVFFTLRALYRLLVHPLAQFPGHKYAAISRSWQGSVVLAGAPEQEYERLHKQYDTQALRIGPNELHISDVKLYKTIYSQTNPFPKHDYFYECFNTPHTLFVETDTSLHKERRKTLNPLFSRTGVEQFQPAMAEKLRQIGAKLRRISKNGPIGVNNMIRSMTVDIISQLAFGSSLGLIEESKDSCEAAFLQAFDVAGAAIYGMYYNPIQKFASSLVSLDVLGKLDPGLGELARLQRYAKDSHARFIRRNDEAKQSSPHPIIFDRLMGVPIDQQVTESIDILVAGSDTTAFTLTVCLNAVLANVHLKRKVVAAVDEAMPDPHKLPSFVELEKNAYLFAVVKESLRFAMAVPGMLPRVVPERSQPFMVDGKVVPPGTVVGMSAYTMNFSEELWGPDAKEYKPERWLGEQAKTLDSGLATFSKGSRQCIGINVANAEVILAITYLFRNFDMDLVTPSMKLRDVFTYQVLSPGLQVRFMDRT